MLTSGSYSDSGLLTSGDVVKTVTAPPPPTTGDLTINTTTSGTGLPTGYRFSASGPGGSVTDTIGLNSSRTFRAIPAGSYTVQLGDVPAHCTVSGSNPRTVTVPGGGAPRTTFAVSCAAPVPAPVASFTFSCSALSCSFDASRSEAQADATYRWSWGDGTAAGSGQTASHTYAAGGSYSVRLTVSDGGGSSSTSQVVSVVQPNRPPSVNAGPNESVLLGLSYMIWPSFSDPDHGPWSYRIEWGDGSATSGTRSSPGKFSAGHNYLLPGRYTIRVTVTDSRGLSGSDTKVVTVLTPLPGLP
jgi:PKD repeat protein